MTGADIRRAREARGWTQRELAVRMGVTGRTVRNWERTGAMHGRSRARLAVLLRDDPGAMAALAAKVRAAGGF